MRGVGLLGVELDDQLLVDLRVDLGTLGQLVNHGHFLVNGVNVNIPSYRVSRWDIIDVKPKSMVTDPFIIAKELVGDRPIPAWLQVVPSSLRILVHQLPERPQIDTQVNEQLIVELYSK